MTAPELLPWERQQGEPDDAWTAFQKFRDMPSPRVIKYVAVAPISVIYAWANEWRWHERSVAYDRHTDALRRAERESLLKQTEADRTAAAVSMLKGTEELFERELQKLLAESHASEMSIAKVNDLTKMLDKIITLRRLVHGESTENVNVTTTEFDLSKLSLDELRQWRELQSKVAKDGEE